MGVSAAIAKDGQGLRKVEGLVTFTASASRETELSRRALQDHRCGRRPGTSRHAIGLCLAPAVVESSGLGAAIAVHATRARGRGGRRRSISGHETAPWELLVGPGR